MSRKAILAGAGLGCFLAAIIANRIDGNGTPGGEMGSGLDAAIDQLDEWTGGFVKVASMKKLKGNAGAYLASQNVKAFLTMLRKLETGRTDSEAYHIRFPGVRFESLADHPRIKVKSGGYTSSAAGAYQINIASWDEVREALGLPDFSIASQDIAAVALLQKRGALKDVAQGKFKSAIQNRNLVMEWASLPGRGSQSKYSVSDALQLIASSGADMGSAYA